MKGSKEEFQERREAEINSEPFADGFEFDESKERYLLRLLENTVYSEERKHKYESEIKTGLTMQEYEKLKNLFYADKVDDVTMRGTYGQRELKKHLGKLK